MSVLQPVTDPADAVVRASKLSKTYGRGEAAVHALREVDVQIGRGEFTAIMGPSGSGKSTLMHCLAGLDSVTGGEIILDGEVISAMSQRQLTRLRREKIGFIFQSFNLIPTLSAEENIRLPADIAKRPVSQERFDQVVDAVGIRDRLTHRPAELSGGQQQRVACARALVTDPAVIFADEPTGNLDSKSTRQVLAFLRAAVDSFQQTVVMVTHEPDAAAWADRVLFLDDGRVTAQLDAPTRDTVLDALRELGDDLEGEVAPATNRADLDRDSTTPTPLPHREPQTTSIQRRETVPLANTTTPTHAAPAVAVQEHHATSHGDTPTAATHVPEESELAPRPGESLPQMLQRIAPGPQLDPQTNEIVQAARAVLSHLPGSVVPEDEAPLTGMVPIQPRVREVAEPELDRQAQSHPSDAPEAR